MYKCDIFWQEIETNTNLSASRSYEQILAQRALVFTVEICFTLFPLRNVRGTHILSRLEHNLMGTSEML